MAETSAQARERRRQNSLAEQRDRFARTGRLTKGLLNNGYIAVGNSTFTATTDQSPFSVAADLLGPNATQSQIAAFVQSQGWTSFRAGKEYTVRATYLEPNARPSTAFMAQVTGNAGLYAAGEFKPWLPNDKQGSAPLPGSGVQSMPGTPASSAGLAQYQASERASTPLAAGINTYQQSERGTSPTVAAIQRGNNATAQRYTGLGQMYQQQGLAQYQASERGAPTTPSQGQPAQPYYGNSMLSSARYSGNSTTPTKPPVQGGTNADAQRYTELAKAIQAQQKLVYSALEAAATSGDLNNVPVTMSAYQFANMNWPIVNGVVQSPYVPDGTGGYVLDPNFLSLFDPNTSSGGGGGTDYSYTGWKTTDAKGVGVYRPRRGGVSTVGTDTFSPVLDGGWSPLSEPGGFPASWSIGIG